MRTAIWVLAFALIIQLGLPHVVPPDWIYQNRVEYTVVKNNMAADLNLAMAYIAKDIRQHPDRESIILLGDSVTYSGPGTASQSIGYYLEQQSAAAGRPVKVYNLAQPGMMLADIYTEVLMLQAHQIPLDRVVINQGYADFVPYDPAYPFIGWLGDELRRLDPEAWRWANGQAGPAPSKTKALREWLMGPIALWQHRDFLRARLPLSTTKEFQDTRPWTEKRLWLTSLMKEPMYQRWVDQRPFDLSPQNPRTQMLERMLQKLEGSDLTVWINPVNQELLGLGTRTAAFRENAAQAADWFRSRGLRTLNLIDAIPSDRFTDHVHLTPDGYRELAALLGEPLLSAQSQR